MVHLKMYTPTVFRPSTFSEITVTGQMTLRGRLLRAPLSLGTNPFRQPLSQSQVVLNIHQLGIDFFQKPFQIVILSLANELFD